MTKGIVPPESCPRCHSRPHIVYLGLNFGYVECIQCEKRTDDMQIDDAIEQWNRKVKNGTCESCKRWYLNAPDYGLNITEWICGKDHPKDDKCNCYLGVEE